MNLKGAFHLIGTPLYSWYSYPQNQCHLLMFICNEILYMSPLKMRQGLAIIGTSPQTSDFN